MSATKVLITGATGYIGGSVLTALLASSNPKIKRASLSVLVRKQEQAAIFEERGVNAVVFNGLDDLDALRKAASEHDVVVDTATAFDPAATEALVLGLADRKSQTGNETHLIHQSGTSNVADRPVTGSYVATRVMSDKDNIYAYLRYREDLEQYPQRTSDLVVFEKGEAADVRTYIIMSPNIYGLGSGLFNRTSIQIDTMMRVAYRDGFASVIGPGASEWDHVHIEDLVELYELILARLLAGDTLPSNKKGIYFNETGHHTWREMSELVAKYGHDLGYLKSDGVREVSLEEAAKKYGVTLPPSRDPARTELGFASRSRTRADLAREIGWKPKKTKKDFEASFAEEWKVIGGEAEAKE